MSDEASHAKWKPRSNPWLIAVVVTLAAFMEVLDTTIVNVALPHISGTMSASYDESTWTLTSYLVANGIVLPLSAFFSKILGRKRYFLICIAAFTVCSLLCGIATNLWQLIVFRILQGFFGGGLQPSQQSIILDTFPPEQRGRAFSISAVAIVVAPVLGPTLGGWITDNFTWRWVFLLNVPIGVMTTIAVMQFVEDPPWEKKQSRKDAGIDFIGIGLIALGLGCLQVFLDRGEDDDWFHSNFIITFAVLAAVGIIGATVWLIYAKKPVVNLRVMKDRNFALGSLAIVGFASILYGSAVLIPQLAQQQLGYTATLAGLVLSPGALLIVFLIPIVSKLMPIVQTRVLVAFGFIVMGCAMLYSHHLVPNVDYRTLMMMRSAQSAGIGFLFVPVTTLAYLTLPKSMNNDASALFTMFRNVSGSVGISLATAAIRERTQANMAHMVEHLTPLNQPYNDSVQRIARTLIDSGQTMSQAFTAATGQMYKTLVSQATILAYLDVFSACAIFSFMFVPLAFFFSPAKASGQGGGH
ncbi:MULTISPECIES: DHA2 family efflux MFS transporter permease subunit [unclassified Caballeronia]|uniref:DHA2 family efflux MFS transporter permease subunit n=1 Tax=unclassified Caballeronia TaxID=2646786 RepID=UPI002863F7A9|nr:MULTISPECIES: DHA2 family efflux MFS transporter permease subunit [unclassified Caballeronia]MDR5752334.1 DHA2 family efflux MFS transporter permease subunit [Caballeronia sp. LZ024]MDR5841852.1 DHA2 family efflux MFS transporter permease subunit [Caballeronia sp. LZ031]